MAAFTYVTVRFVVDPCRYKSVGFLLNSMRSRNKAVWRFRGDPTFKASSKGEGSSRSKGNGPGDLQLIADYVYCLLHLGTAWVFWKKRLSSDSTFKLERSWIVSQSNPEEALAHALYYDRLPDSEAEVDGAVVQWCALAVAVQSAVDKFLSGTTPSLRDYLQRRASRSSADQHSMQRRLVTVLEKAAEAVVMECSDDGISHAHPSPSESEPSESWIGVLSWTVELWKSLLQTGGLCSDSGADAFLQLVACSLAVAKHALLRLSEGERRILLLFLARSKVLVPLALSGPRASHAAGPSDSQFRRVWVSESSLCTELALRTLATAAEVPYTGDPVGSTRRQLKGSMILLRVKETAAGNLLVSSMGQALAQLESTNPIVHAFVIIPDFGKQSLRATFESPSKYYGAWFQRLQGDVCEAGTCCVDGDACAKSRFEVEPGPDWQTFVRPTMERGGAAPASVTKQYLTCTNCEHVHHPVREYGDLDGLPTLLVVVGKGRMGDTVRGEP